MTTLIIQNLTSGTLTYLGGAASVAGNTSYTVPLTQLYPISRDAGLVADVSSGNVTVSDGVNLYGTALGLNFLNQVATSLSSSVIGYTGTAAPNFAILVGSKDSNGNIKPAMMDQNSNINIVIGDSAQRDGWGRIRVADTDLIESLHFANTSHPLLVNNMVTGSGNAAYNSAASSIRLSNTTSSSDSTIVQTKRYFRYNPGRSYIFTASGNIGAPKTNVTQRIGYFDVNNGLFFEQTSSGISVKIRTNSSGSPVDTTYAQSSWNIDKLDGTGYSGITLDPSKHNLYVIDFLWHGAGRVRFGIIYNGILVYCHQVNGANVSASPYIRTPSLPMRAELNNTGTVATSTTMDVVCFAFQKEASDSLNAPYNFSTSTGISSKTVSSTLIPIISIRPKLTFNSVTNRVPVIPVAANVMTNQQNIYVAIILNPTLTGASFASAGSNSVVEADSSATAISGGTIIQEFYVPGSSSLVSSISANITSALELLSLGLDIGGSVQDIVCIAAKSVAGGSATWAQISWQEFQ